MNLKNVEIENKFLVENDAIKEKILSLKNCLAEELALSFGSFQNLVLDSYYFDTTNSSLSEQKLALRIRNANFNKTSVICLKGPKFAENHRLEWEKNASRLYKIKDDLDFALRSEILKFIDDELAGFSQENDKDFEDRDELLIPYLLELEKILLSANKLHTIASTHITRDLVILKIISEGEITEIELAFDFGYSYNGANGERSDIRELELEFKRGNLTIFNNFVVFLKNKFSLLENKVSKLEQALNRKSDEQE